MTIWQSLQDNLWITILYVNNVNKKMHVNTVYAWIHDNSYVSISAWLYVNLWMPVCQYVHDCMSISAWLHVNLCMHVSQSLDVHTYKTICQNIYDNSYSTAWLHCIYCTYMYVHHSKIICILKGQRNKMVSTSFWTKTLSDPF